MCQRFLIHYFTSKPILDRLLCKDLILKFKHDLAHVIGVSSHAY
jgi:hypothetical protein